MDIRPLCFVVCCVGSSLWDELISIPEETYRLCVCVSNFVWSINFNKEAALTRVWILRYRRRRVRKPQWPNLRYSPFILEEEWRKPTQNLAFITRLWKEVLTLKLPNRAEALLWESLHRPWRWAARVLESGGRGLVYGTSKHFQWKILTSYSLIHKDSVLLGYYSWPWWWKQYVSPKRR
jgi:hypothetical protein